MPEKEILVLGDKNIVPDDKLIFSKIGERKSHWQEIMEYARSNYPGVTEEWRYYNDGKQWLFKMQLKKKTIFWIGILKDTFRITFYFGNKAEPFIEASDLPDKIKEGFRTGPRYGAIRAISLKVAGEEDVDIVKILIPLKVKMK
ncbi:MAG: DUF3788 family protein [Bacteroidales bacterium]|nr:DUF3788 family protein [Bacteroidales bacterium]